MDMNPHFRRAARICFPKAAIVAAQFRVLRQAGCAMERVRKNKQSRLSQDFRKYFKKSRYLLMKPKKCLTEEEMNRLALMFEIAPRPADAYRLKNDFQKVTHCGFSQQGRQLLIDWLQAVEVMDLPEFSDCVKAYRNWFHEILNSMDVP